MNLHLLRKGVPETSGIKDLEAREEMHPGWELRAGASVSWDGLPRCKHIWSPSGRDLEHQDSQYTSDWGCEALRMSQAFPPTPTSLSAISSLLLGRITSPRQEVGALEGAWRRAGGPGIAPKPRHTFSLASSLFGSIEVTVSLIR